MALTYITVTVSNPKNGKRAFKRKLLVDSGAVYSVLPEKNLQKIGIKPIDKQEFILASGESVVKDIGQAEIELYGKKRVVPVTWSNNTRKLWHDA